MATKKGSSKKSSTKKSAGKKSSKKSAKKATVKSGITAKPAVGFPNLNLRCILAAVAQYNSCIKKGVDPATCQKRLQRNIMNCMGGGGGIFDPSGGGVLVPGGDVE